MPPGHFYREAQGLTISTLGLGTYLGEMDDASDRGYIEAIFGALDGGVNLIDTSLNYRHQRSERAIGQALKQTGVSRDRIVICTKAGYLVPGAVPAGLRPDVVVGAMHCMAPEFLADQIGRSRANLGVDVIDVFYLHNPETQLEYVSDNEFLARVDEAFSYLESSNEIRFYGMATWSGFRNGRLSIGRLVEAARLAGGDNHRFRFIQLPFNFAMTEALRLGVLEEAVELGVSVVASASLLQTRILGQLPEPLRAKFDGLETDAQRAIQFARSAPGICSALVGMGRAEHVRENLDVARIPPLGADEFRLLFQ